MSSNTKLKLLPKLKPILFNLREAIQQREDEVIAEVQYICNQRRCVLDRALGLKKRYCGNVTAINDVIEHGGVTHVVALDCDIRKADELPEDLGISPFIQFVESKEDLKGMSRTGFIQANLYKIEREEKSLTLSILSENSQEFKEPGFAAKATSLDEKQQDQIIVPLQVQIGDDGIHRVSFAHLTSGAYEIAVTLGGAHLEGSPFDLNLRSTFIGFADWNQSNQPIEEQIRLMQEVAESTYPGARAATCAEYKNGLILNMPSSLNKYVMFVGAQEPTYHTLNMTTTLNRAFNTYNYSVGAAYAMCVVSSEI